MTEPDPNETARMPTPGKTDQPPTEGWPGSTGAQAEQTGAWPPPDAALAAEPPPADAALRAEAPTADPPPTPPPAGDAVRAEAFRPDPTPAARRRSEPDSGRAASVVFGLVMLAIGLWFFAEQTLGLDLPPVSWSQIWPVILIGLGVWIVLGSMRRGPR